VPATHELYPFLDTPALVLDLDKMEANIKEMADVARDPGVKLRPHIKNDKSQHPVECSLNLNKRLQSMTG
jgi:D-serine deaminase-like pyridoxal phosphate-dependent protein